MSRAARIEELLELAIEPHVATDERHHRPAHDRVRRRARDEGDRRSQRCPPKIDELFGAAKDWYGLRRFRRRGLLRVHEEAYPFGGLLNLERLVVASPVALHARAHGLALDGRPRPRSCG